MNKEALKNKSGEWYLKRIESGLKDFLVPKVPKWLETYHLTGLTLIWSGLMIYFFYMGSQNELYLFLVPILVLLQYLSDLLDGEVGRRRNTGLVRWGYYADHLLDFVFITSIIAGYAIILGMSEWIFALYAIVSGFHVSTYLLVSADGEFKISFLRFGPTEARILFIILHLVIVSRGILILNTLLPYLVLVSALALVSLIFINQYALWQKDLSKKIKK
ncbi:MAG: CDP-alcohol phosphatidyltransferase family protein [Candidatus Peregrinibacteria bacterium]|nr:CDP-alcohol phosphatidyltransferase family protein [Candidatus Peregrinibacteria bacterium]